MESRKYFTNITNFQLDKLDKLNGMTIKSFEDILSWQKSKQLTVLIYKQFSDSKDFGFRDQIQRASVSILNNIAEGFERKSNKELKLYLYYAKGSCGEVRSMLYLAFDLNIINEKDFKLLYELSLEISKLLSAFIKSI